MLKYCKGCKRDLEIDHFYSYKKSTCKECVNKKVKCDYCDKEFNSTNLSKHMKQRHSTYDSSRPNDSTSNNSTANNSTSVINRNNSTSNRSLNNDTTSNSRSEQINDSTYYNLSDHKILRDFNDTLKNNISYDKKDIDEINSLLTKCRMFGDKLYEETITQKEKRQYITIINKLKKLNYFNKEICDYIIDGIHKYG